MCVECVSGQRNIITPMPIAMSPTVQALTAQRDALLEAEQRYQLDLHTVKAERDALLAALEECVRELDTDDPEAQVTYGLLDRARLAIARATAGKP